MRQYKPTSRGVRAACILLLAGAVSCMTVGCTQPAAGPTLADTSKEIVFRVGVSNAKDPLAAGKAAAQAAKDQLAKLPAKAVLLAEYYEDKGPKSKVLEGVCSVFDKGIVYGGATYGSFTQAGAMGNESVTVLAIAGKDIEIRPACREKLGTAALTPSEHKDQIEQKLTAAGADLAKMLPKTPDSRAMIVIADAHSPKNDALVRGIQTVTGDDFPLIGGCVCKNQGQTYVYYQGKMLADSAIALMLVGDFKVALAGRKAKENDKVIATAKEAAAEALERLDKLGAKPAAALVFDCAGRKSKLDNVADELAAMQGPLGKQLPIFGSYNAGEIGPADTTEKKPGVLSSGMGWHVMFAVIGW